MTERGGPQVIPRPERWRAGGPSPWAHLAPGQRRVDLDRLAESLAARDAGYRESGRQRSGRVSAVLAPLYVVDDEPAIILTRRASTMRHHSLEVSFPGGGHDEIDGTYQVTALREAEEEISLDRGAVTIIGELDRFVTGGSGSLVHPFVGRIEGSVSGLRPNPAEVEQILHVPLSELTQPDVWREELWERDGREIRITFFELVGNTVWGATAAMLRQLLTIALGLEEGDDPLG